MRKPVVFALLLLCTAMAYQPRFVLSNITYVPEPEISKAYYGELNGTPAFFFINSSQPFRLHAEVLAPDTPEAGRDISLWISSPGRDAVVPGSNSSWDQFYEGSSGDYYLAGPEFAMNASAGNYTLIVYGPANQGKYVLVVGEDQSMPPAEIANAIALAPALKTFCGKSPLEAVRNPFVEMAVAPILAIPLAYLLLRSKIPSLRKRR